MRNYVSRASSAASRHVAFAFFWICSLLLVPMSSAAEATPTPVADQAKQRLERIFLGEAPQGIDDLRAMQEHVKAITGNLLKSTVGVQIGPAWGSGVIISKDGYVLTAAHVAGKANRRVRFTLHDGTEMFGKTLGLNRTLDAGLMKIEGSGDLPFAVMGAGEAKEGQWCMAIGHPGGYLEDRGMVLRVGRVLLTDKAAVTSDCTLVGGDSGGPLFNMQGHVIGINSRIAGAITANLHVPVDRYRESWDRMAKGEEWGHYPGHEPMLGVRGDKDAQEAKVAKVVDDSPAAKAGIQVGDVILKFGGVEIKDFPSVVAAVQEHQPGDKVKLQLKRGEQNVEVTVTLVEREPLD